MTEFFAVLTAFFIVATATPVIASSAWWVRVFDFPRPQLLVMSSLTVSAELVLLEPTAPLTIALATLGSLCAASQLARILPFTPLWRKQVPCATGSGQENSLGILVANVLTSNRDASLVLAFIEREEPDIVIALETDAWWEKQLNCLQATYPHTLQCALDNLYGMHLYSRLPLKNPQLEYLVQEGVPSMHALLQLPCGRHVLLHALHPAPPFPGENDEAQPRDIEILVVARSLEKHAGKPVIVAGDMNDVPWSRTLRGFLATSGLGDPRRGRGLYNTYHASHRLMRWPLDHVFVSRHFAVERVARSHPIGSDHFAYFTRLRLQPDAPESLTSREDGTEVQQWAREKIAQGDVDAADVPDPGAPR
tara:strand:- start:27675 stop:28766 length:1092 start_codon:yes stop_codon:yes gene_type:complete